MNSESPSDPRLAILSRHSLRPWESHDEQRRCILCDRVFTARQVRIRQLRDETTLLRCPTRGCQAGPRLWVHPDDPLISTEAWNDWDRLIATVEPGDGEEDERGILRGTRGSA